MKNGRFLLALDRLDRVIAQIVRHVFGRIKAVAAVERHGKGQIGPKKFVDRIEVLFRIHDV